jgi:hypothetical protein
MTEKLIQELASSIKNYLTQRPDAADTLEGITRWWIGGSSPDASPELVAAALEVLIREGVVSKVSVGERLLYRRARNA